MVSKDKSGENYTKMGCKWELQQYIGSGKTIIRQHPSRVNILLHSSIASIEVPIQIKYRSSN